MRPIFEILSNLPSADSLILHFSAFQNSSRVIFTKDLGWLPIQRVTTATDRVKHVSQGFTASSLRHLSHTSIALRRRGEGMQTLKGGICWQSRTLSTIRRSGLPRTHSKAATSHPLLPLLVSCGHHNKAPQVWWLRTIGIYSLTVLETRSLKSVIWVGGPCSFRRPREFIPRHSHLPGGCKHSLACICITPISTSAVTFSLFLWSNLP